MQWPKGNSRNYPLSCSGGECESLSEMEEIDLHDLPFCFLVLFGGWNWPVAYWKECGLWPPTRLVSEFPLFTFVKHPVNWINSLSHSILICTIGTMVHSSRAQCKMTMQDPLFKQYYEFQDGDSRAWNQVQEPFSACVTWQVTHPWRCPWMCRSFVCWPSDSFPCLPLYLRADPWKLHFHWLLSRFDQWEEMVGDWSEGKVKSFICLSPSFTFSEASLIVTVSPRLVAATPAQLTFWGPTFPDPTSCYTVCCPRSLQVARLLCSDNSTFPSVPPASVKIAFSCDCRYLDFLTVPCLAFQLF